MCIVILSVYMVLMRGEVRKVVAFLRALLKASTRGPEIKGPAGRSFPIPARALAK
jgi:hypothetical protein